MAGLSGTTIAAAATGDVIVGDRNFEGNPTFLGAVFRVPAAGGAPLRLTAAGAPLGPQGIAIEGSGWILESQFGAVNRINPITGAITPLATGAPLNDPYGIAIEATGNLLVADPGTIAASDGQVLRVNAKTGATTVLASGGMLVDPQGIVVASNGDAILADRNGNNSGYILRINRVTGAQTVVASGASFRDPTGVDFTSDGRLVVADEAYAGQFRGALLRINTQTGAVVPVSLAGTNIDLATFVAVDKTTGQVLVTDRGDGEIHRVNLATATATTFSTGLVSPLGIAFERATTPACTVTAVRTPGPSGRAEQDVTVTDFSGLSSLSNVQVTNGQVFTGGSSGTRIDPAGTSLPSLPTSVVVTAVKTSASAKTVWSFDVTNTAGRTKRCA